jgi:hypothetical protein
MAPAVNVPLSFPFDVDWPKHCDGGGGHGESSRTTSMIRRDPVTRVETLALRSTFILAAARLPAASP